VTYECLSKSFRPNILAKQIIKGDNISGGFRHVRPNRVPQKRGPTKGAANLCNIACDSDNKKVASFQEKMNRDDTAEPTANRR